MSKLVKVQPKQASFNLSAEGQGEFNSIVNEVLDTLKNKPLSFKVAIAVLQEAERQVMGNKISWS